MRFRKISGRRAVVLTASATAAAGLVAVLAARPHLRSPGGQRIPDHLPWESKDRGDQKALSDLYWEFKDRPEPWDERTKFEYTERCMAIADRYPGTYGAAQALRMAVVKGDPVPATGSFSRLIETAPLPVLANVVDETARGWPDATRPFAPALLARARSALDQPEAPLLLAAVCRTAASGPVCQEAADLLVERFPAHPATAAVPEVLGGNTSGRVPPSAPRAEQHLRALLNGNPTAETKARSAFALACLLQGRGGRSTPEAASMLAGVCDQAATAGFPDAAALAFAARERLKGLRSGAVGMPAPATAGPDLDGKDLSLAAYRGRVVLVVFWATWCQPCMRLVPHEVELADRYRGRPFEILGVNCDATPAPARAAAARLKMSWRSLARTLGPDDQRIPLAETWAAAGIPLACLVDPAGVVRYRWNGAPPARELDEAVERLVAAAEGKPAGPGAE